MSQKYSIFLVLFKLCQTVYLKNWQNCGILNVPVAEEIEGLYNSLDGFLTGKMQRNGIEALVDEVAGWGRGGVWVMDVVEQAQATYFFNVTRCPYYEKYRELGLEEFGVGFSCCRDEP